MAIELVRIDDRLIHGQVATTWLNDFEIEQVLIISDKHAQDQIQQKVLLMTAPKGVKIHFFGVEQFNSILDKKEINKRTMLLYTNPVDVLKNVKGNLNIDKLNYGNIRFAKERVQYTTAISLTPKEVEATRELIAAGLEVFWQMVPAESKVSLSKIISGK